MIIETGEKPKRRTHSEPESRLQAECFSWFWNTYPEYRGLMFHVPSEGNRSSKIDGGKRKAMGIVAGVSDLILMLPRHNCHGLCIEMKTEDGRQSDKQKEWQRKVTQQGYDYRIIRSVVEFKTCVTEYIFDNG